MSNLDIRAEDVLYQPPQSPNSKHPFLLFWGVKQTVVLFKLISELLLLPTHAKTWRGARVLFGADIQNMR